ncbi:MAG: 2-amino-4-hydroxy-6-hydroxymethyldihydropteridine diphosphokinase [bacterium]
MKCSNYVLSLGSNIGKKKHNINEALSFMAKAGMEVEKTSSFYRTSPVDRADQPDFVNRSVVIESSLMPEDMLGKIKDIEKEMGRVSVFDKGPRIIDIDIIFWGGGNYKSSDLSIPHKRWNRRLFVLKPTGEVLKDLNCFSEESSEIKNILSEKSEIFEEQRVEKA